MHEPFFSQPAALNYNTHHASVSCGGWEDEVPFGPVHLEATRVPEAREDFCNTIQRSKTHTHTYRMSWAGMGL